MTDIDVKITVPHGATSEQIQRAMLELAIREAFPKAEWDDPLRETARRVLGYWKEFANPPAIGKFTTFKAEADELIIVKDIEFSSMCCHHLLPFIGYAHVGYIPKKLQVGLSKIPRVVDFFGRRPQVQERLTNQIASYLVEQLKPAGVIVVVESKHTCMGCRGIRRPGAAMITSSLRGVFEKDAAARAEFYSLIGREKL